MGTAPSTESFRRTDECIVKMRVCPEDRFDKAGLEGTPFQMPTRLADGLGLGSDLTNRFPGSSTPQLHDKVQRWVPRVEPQEGGTT